jgi:transcriptional regulator with XRE-family HTH domain
MDGGSRGRNVARQREIYGTPLGDLIRWLTTELGISQARLADALGVSSPMLCQLASGYRVKIGDPEVLARLALLVREVRRHPPTSPAEAAALVAHVRGSHPRLVAATPAALAAPAPTLGAHAALRAVGEPAELTAAANLLGSRFPRLAELFRRAAMAPATNKA